MDVHLSPGVRSAFADLAAAVHRSQHFSADALKTVQDISTGKTLSVDDLVGSFPIIAEQTFRHIQATGDNKALDAWHAIGSELLESGFKLAQERHRRP